MKRMSRMICTLALLLVTAGTAQAVGLLAKSTTINPLGGFPAWLQDQNGLALQNCLDQGPCILPVPGTEPNFPGGPLSFPVPLNFPSESFFFYAESNFQANAAAVRVVMGVEAAFAPSVAAGNQTMFHRFRVRITNPPVSGVYTLNHPWGTTTFTGQPCTAGVRCDATADTNTGLPPDFAGILGASPDGAISHFLTQPTPPAGFIGDGVTPTTVTGGPVRNTVELLNPAGAIIGTSNLFIIAGKKIGMEVNPSPTAQMTGVVAATPPTTTPVTITNLSGAAIDFSAATAIQIDPASPNAVDFTLAAPAAGVSCLGNAAVGSVAPNNTCSFNVVFNPLASAVAARKATVKITPAAANTNAPATTLALAGTAQFPVTVTVGANGVLQKIAGGGNVSAVSENVDAGTTIKYLAVPNDVVPNVSKYLTFFEVNDVAVQPAADGTFSVAVDDAPKAVEVTFVRPGDVSVDPVSGAGDGQVSVADALEALKIATGVNATPTGPQRIAADVGPLVAGKPTPDGVVDVSDVLVILWRAISQPPTW